MSEHAHELGRGERFAFGKNWQAFLDVLNEERIARAVQSLQAMLELETLAGKSFLDIGCGSGLFSLAARRLGARVRSFDYDPQSVACTQELRRRFFTEDSHWAISTGSALDQEFLKRHGCPSPALAPLRPGAARRSCPWRGTGR